MKPFILILILVLSGQLLTAQISSSSSYIESPQQLRPFDEESWQEISADIDYTGDMERQPSEAIDDAQQDNNFFWDTSWFGKGAFAILIGLTVLAIGLFIYYRLKNTNPRNQRLIRGKQVANLETIETNLDDIDPTSAIEQAIQSGDYRLALRLYYLKSLRELFLAGYIQWKRDKTNGEYSRELSGHVLRPDFMNLTLLFERIWYGNQEIDAIEFQQIQPQFDQFLKQIQANAEQ